MRDAAVCAEMLRWMQATLPPGELLLEPYCGNGNATLPLAASFARVLASDVAPLAVSAAAACAPLGHAPQPHTSATTLSHDPQLHPSATPLSHAPQLTGARSLCTPPTWSCGACRPPKPARRPLARGSSATVATTVRPEVARPRVARPRVAWPRVASGPPCCSTRLGRVSSSRRSSTGRLGGTAGLQPYVQAASLRVQAIEL